MRTRAHACAHTHAHAHAHVASTPVPSVCALGVLTCSLSLGDTAISHSKEEVDVSKQSSHFQANVDGFDRNGDCDAPEVR